MPSAAYISPALVSRLMAILAACVVSLGGLWISSVALADDLAVPNPFQKFSDPKNAVLAVQTTFDVEAGHVRLVAYANEQDFLEEAAAKFDARLDETGLALLKLDVLSAGEYAFVVYLDENKDGKLNRSFLGRPREPFIFSNGVKPKFRRPNFDETKTEIAAGKVVVITLDK